MALFGRYTVVGRKNGGYTIVAQRPCQGSNSFLLIVLAENDEGGCVTWLYNAESDGFGGGHYFEEDDRKEQRFLKIVQFNGRHRL